MVRNNGNGHKARIARLTAARYAAQNEPTGSGFVRVVCPYSVARVGLARVLQQAGIRHDTEPPYGNVPYCVALYAQDAAEDLPEAFALARKASPEAPILVFAPRSDLKLALAALRCGARGFVHAEMPPEQLLRAFEVVSKGEIAAPRDLLEYLLAKETSSQTLDDLSNRQQEIVRLVAEGCSNEQIAKCLFLTKSTVKQHLRHAYKALGVKSRTQAAWIVRRTPPNRYCRALSRRSNSISK